MPYWSGGNPSLYPCRLHAGGVIGPYLFVDGVTIGTLLWMVSVSCAMITDQFWPELEATDLDDMWCKQGMVPQATCHKTTIDLLKSSYGERVNSGQMGQTIGRPVRWI